MLKKHQDIIIKTIIIFTISILFIGLIKYSSHIIGIFTKLISLCLPFIIGLIFGYILNPVVKIIEKKMKCKRLTAIGVTYFIILSIIVFSSIFIAPKIYQSIVDLIKETPYYITSIQEWINNLLADKNINFILNSIGLNNRESSNILSSIITNLGSFIGNSAIFIKNISTWIMGVVLGLFVSIYVLIDKDIFKTESKKVMYIILKKDKAEKIIEFITLYHKMIGTYIGIKAIDSMIIGTMAFVLLHITGSKHATLLALIVGITNMIPYFGPFIGEIVGFLLNVFTSPTKAIIVFLVLLLLQIFDGWYLDPKLVGNKVGVRPFFIILAVMIGGGFFGAIGMLLASPTIAVIKHYYVKWIEKNKKLIKDI